MLLTLILFAALVSLTFWQTSGPLWLRAVPEWVLPLLAVLAGLALLYRLYRHIRASIKDLSD
ncbi:MAG TPA: hypothetical protein VNZ61_17695 [Roseomonas sp.]|nr:hypothetical protein [Roseomonas sp.]